MRKRLKIMRNSVKRYQRLSLAAFVAIAILAVAAVTVISRQKGTVKEESRNQVSKPLVVTRPATATAQKSYVTVKVAGQNVQVDSQTGQIKPLTPEEQQKLAAGLKQVINQSTDDLVEVQHADGSVSMDLDGHFQNVTVARRNEDGTISQSCVDNAQAAGAFFGIDPRLIDSKAGKGETSNRRAPVTSANPRD